MLPISPVLGLTLFQRVCWYHGTQHLAVLRADFQTHTFSISHTPYRIPKAEDQAAEEADLQRCIQHGWIHDAMGACAAVTQCGC